MATFAQAGPSWLGINAEASTSTASPMQADNNSPRRTKLARGGRGGGIAARAIRGALTQDSDVAMKSDRKARSSVSKAAAFGGAPPPVPIEKKKPYGRLGNHPASAPRDSRANSKHGRKRAKTDIDSSPVSAQETEAFKEFLARRFNPESKLLSLDNLAADPIFQGQLLPPSKKSETNSSTAPAMWKLVGAHYSHTVSLSLADNDLKDLTAIAPLALLAALPNLQNLSMKGNKFIEVKSLNPLTTNSDRRGLSQLKELVLDGNPVYQLAVQTERLAGLQRAVQTRFPTLTTLDGHVLEPLKDTPPTSKPTLGSGLRRPAAFSIGMAPGFADESKDVVTAFLTKFISLFDSNRQAVLAAYSPDATFSLSVNSNIPFRAKSTKEVQDLPKQHKLDWQPYFAQNHNLIKSVKQTGEQFENQITSTLATGPLAIASAFSKLPPTKHPLDQPNLFVLDAWTHPSLVGASPTVFASLHGQFAEGTSKGLRSFDRTFILAPPQAGSSAANEGWPCVVVSDQLLVRGYSEPKAWSAGSLPLLAANPTQNGPSLSPEQQNLLQQLQAATKLNTTFSIQCLVESGWSYELAVANFQKVAASIPPEAFQ